jgi:hypothetical protein
MPSRAAAFSAPAEWGDKPDRPVEPVPLDRLRPHFVNRELWRTREHRPPATVHVPQRRENVARPRERRPATRRRARAPTSDDPSPKTEPPPVEVWRGLAAASVRMVHTASAEVRSGQRREPQAACAG